MMLNVKGEIYDDDKKHNDMCDVEQLISYSSEPYRCDERDEHGTSTNVTKYLVTLKQECDIVLNSECLNESDHVDKHISDGCVASYLVQGV